MVERLTNKKINNTATTNCAVVIENCFTTLSAIFGVIFHTAYDDYDVTISLS